MTDLLRTKSKSTMFTKTETVFNRAGTAHTMVNATMELSLAWHRPLSRSPNGRPVTNGSKWQVQAWTMEITELQRKQWVERQTVCARTLQSSRSREYRSVPRGWPLADTKTCRSRFKSENCQFWSRTCWSRFCTVEIATFAPKHVCTSRCKMILHIWFMIYMIYISYFQKSSWSFIIIPRDCFNPVIICHSDKQEQEWWVSLKQS